MFNSVCTCMIANVCTLVWGIFVYIYNYVHVLLVFVLDASRMCVGIRKQSVVVCVVDVVRFGSAEMHTISE